MPHGYSTTANTAVSALVLLYTHMLDSKDRGHLAMVPDDSVVTKSPVLVSEL